MNVLMISPQFRPVIGGYERAAERLCTFLAGAGIQVLVITERRDKAWAAAERGDGYEVRRLPCVCRRHFHIATSLLSFAGFLLRHGRSFDVWHVHQYGWHAGLAILLGRLVRRPVVLKLTGAGEKGIEKAAPDGIAGRMLSSWLRLPSACLATSPETHAEAIRFGIPRERVHLVPNGVDGGEFHPAAPQERRQARRALGLHAERLVLFVGRLEVQKNPLALLDAWAQIDSKTRRGALLCIVGDGSLADAVAAKARESGPARSVHIAGAQTNAALWYRAADIMVIPSFTEGLSNAMIEAMACGLPVVSTKVSGSSILLGPPPAGRLVSMGSTTELAGAMTELLNDESARVLLGANARRAFESNFDLRAVASSLVALYEALRNPNHSGGAP
jgi:glycosyltransferase involved in cell wall biosynthesis